MNNISQISGNTITDFSNPVVYTVIAEDEITTQEWTVILEIATKIYEFKISVLKVYPNPFTDKTTVEFSNNEHNKYTLSVYGTTGNKVIEMNNITSDKIELKRGMLKAGIYIIELKGEKIFDNKMIIIK